MLNVPVKERAMQRVGAKAKKLMREIFARGWTAIVMMIDELRKVI